MKISKGESLDRYYLFKLFGYGLFLHHIHHSDPDLIYHSHPWSGLSIIFGSYTEVFYNDDGQIETKKRTLFNWIPDYRHHSVKVGPKGVWTLFFHLPRSNTWSIVDNFGNKVNSPWEGEGVNRSYSKAMDAIKRDNEGLSRL